MSALRSGFTTGSCAAAAAKAALWLLARGERVKAVEIPLPDGTRVRLPVAWARRAGDGAEAAVRKDAGDDPDITDGAIVRAAVAWTAGREVEFAAGEGVGTVSGPGLALPAGEPAINPGPRRMIAAAIREVTDRGVRVTVAIPGGEALAARTFNPRIGIRGGLSILGTTGIVRPFSCPALEETVRCALSVAAAAGIAAPVLVPGHIGERAARARFGLAERQVVEVGNAWGFSLAAARRHSFTALMILGHPGKLAKLAAGHWDTHSSRSPGAVPIVAAMQAEILGRPAGEAATVEGLFQTLAAAEKKRLADALAAAVGRAAAERLGGDFPVAVALIDLKGNPLGEAGDLSPWK
jgi:cobalt-precorrin-5B (C1)-methyltransferase